MSSSEADILEGEEEQAQSSAPAPVSPNPNLQASQSDTFSPSVSISSVEGSQASESGDSDYQEARAAGFPRFRRWLDTLRSRGATTNLRSRRSASSTPSTPSPRISSSSSDMDYPVPVFNGTRAPVRFRRSNRDLLTSRISTFMADEGENPPRPRFRNHRIQARAMAQYRASAQARRMRAGLGAFTEEDFRSMERLPAGAFAQIPRRGNSMSDCSQCSSDEEGNKAKGKNTKSKIQPISSQLAEWLYPV
ncbi:uncharacterized protein LOC119553860 [Drosophila subpulchrella]|uniref:uncharacterized protein LOC119553860 n=1 Tax=Drosophila subpulchrella TaxID=1486046 RepID=UPI0018A13A36|nr:uncharacterized protein LOC119553860 [Drosophila subpulchrella]